MASCIEVGGSWSTNEDIALCQSWVNISHDPITGNEMKFHHMWSKIHGEFSQRSGSIRTEMAKRPQNAKIHHTSRQSCEFDSWHRSLSEMVFCVLIGARTTNLQIPTTS
ncbi:unnamed protein product [Prunus armeniaca]